MGKEINCKIYEVCGRDCTNCAAAEAQRKASKIKPRYTTIFEGTQAEKLAAKNLPNYKTYKCPICNFIVAERGFTGLRVHNYCQNCGQALDTEITKEQDT